MEANGEGHRQETRGLTYLARRVWSVIERSFFRGPRTVPPSSPSSHAAPSTAELLPLRRILLSDGVFQTLFEEFAEHRQGPQGREETGWILLGVRDRDEALALATLPAGAQRDAGIAHVQFNSEAQAVGSRIVRQIDRRLTILGVVHTHPGSLRHPSDGDFEGDRLWVKQLRGGEGVFGIGTADGRPNGHGMGPLPKPNVQARGELLFSWYSLGVGERQYRPLAVEVTSGADLARPLHHVWPTLEEHAGRLDRLFRQQVGLKVEPLDAKTLAVTVPLAEKGDRVQVLLGGERLRYLVSQGGDLFEVDPGARSIDQGVYLLLAELAARGP